MAVGLPPLPPQPSIGRVNPNGTPTQAQIDYERQFSKWVSDYIATILGGALPLPTATTLGGVKSATSPTHQFQRGIDGTGSPLFGQPAAADIAGLGPFATGTSVPATSVTGLAAIATSGLASDLIGSVAVPTPTPTTLGGLFSGSAPALSFATGLDTSGNLQYRQPAFTDIGGQVTAAQFAAQIAHFVLAGPASGLSGIPTFRQLSASDLSDGTTGTGNIVLSDAPTFTNLAHGASLTLSGTLTAATVNGTNITGTAVNGTVGGFNSITSNSATFVTATIAELTVDLTAGGGTSTGTIGTFKDQDGVNTRVLIDSVGTSAIPILDFRRARGTTASPSATQTDDNLGSITGRGYGATGYNLTTASASFQFFAAENWTDTAQGSYYTFGTTPKGSTSRAERMRLDDAGRLGIGRTPTTYLLEVAGDIFSTGAFRGSGANLTGITSGQVSGLAAVATSGSATDLGSGTLPAGRLPNPAASTLGGVKSLAAVSHKFLTSIGTDGLPVAAQPASTDISGLGTAATQNTGTSGANIPLLNAANTFSALQTFSVGIATTQAPTSAHTIDSSGSGNQITIANGGNVALAAGFLGLVIVGDITNGQSGVFAARLGGQAAIDSNGIIAGTAPGAGQSSFGWNGSTFAVYNNTGASHTYNVAFIKTH